MEQSISTRSRAALPHSFGSVAEAVRFAPGDAIFDVAVPLLSSYIFFRSYPITRPC